MTVEFVLLTVPIGIVLGLALAVLAHQRLRGIAIFRTIFSSTVVTSVAVASLISLTLLNPQIGLLNYWLGPTGEPLAARRPEVGARRGRGRDDLAEPRPLVHHHVGRAAGGPRRAARGGARRRRGRVVALLAT